MIRQKSFENDQPTLYLVATPIGNLGEMTPRAIEILKSVDVIAAEDTRNTMKLLSHFDIQTHCIAHHMHNEYESAKGLLTLLEEGKNVALVSDAGYPDRLLFQWSVKLDIMWSLFPEPMRHSMLWSPVA